MCIYIYIYVRQCVCLSSVRELVCVSTGCVYIPGCVRGCVGCSGAIVGVVVVNWNGGARGLQRRRQLSSGGS